MKVARIGPYKGCTKADGTVDVYDVTVDGIHLYFANNVLVSNSKRISMLDVNALLSHGAVENLRDVGSIRGQRNEQYWLQFMQGHMPSAVKTPMVYDKFHHQLKASGINVVRDGPRTHIMALTNKDVDALAGERILKHGETVNFDKELKPVAGGLFDPAMTGGHGGKQWSKIKFDEPMPNPVMEEPMRRILGLTAKQFEGVLSGTEKLGQHGTGSKAIKAALEDVNLTKELATTRAQVHSSSRAKRDEAVRKLGYLKSAQSLGLHPKDWMLDHAPVLPPAFRPVSMMGQSGIPLVSDPNYLYKELIEANKNLGEMKGMVGHENVGAERLAVYHAFKAVTGLGDPITQKSQDKNVKGILKSIFGTSPKFGTVQRKLLSSTVDNVGRAVISPNPDYDMDTVGIPEAKAFEVYSKFLVRRMHRQGMPVSQALQHVKDKTDKARSMLQEEMEDRPVFINRAPVLHRFGIMAFRPKLVKGDTMQVSPLIVKGFNADFDGDAMQFHVPTSDEAKKEALERMLPSKNLLSPADFKSPVHVPGQEYLGGLHHATTARKEKGRPRVFRNKQDALAALHQGEITEDTPVHIME